MNHSATNNWIDWGGDGPLLHFAHANGFPSRTYRVLLEDLCRDFHVVSSEARPMWDRDGYPRLQSWQDLAEDLAATLRKHGARRVIGVGHSLGGAMSFMAAVNHPDLFSAVIPIDPVTLSGIPSLVWRIMQTIGLRNRLPLVQGALRRQHRWPSPEVARRAYAGKPAFRTWLPEVIDDYVDTAFVATNNNAWTLRYPREWEARIFAVSPASTFATIARIPCPGLFIRGEDSHAFFKRSVPRIQRCNPLLDVKTIPATGHFVPMENPAAVAQLIRQFCATIGRS